MPTPDLRGATDQTGHRDDAAEDRQPDLQRFVDPSWSAGSPDEIETRDHHREEPAVGPLDPMSGPRSLFPPGIA
jgi:hypothetical protein